MSILTEVELLRRIPLFSNIDTSRLKLLAFTSERLTFEDGAILFREGDRGDSAYLILAGKVDISVGSPNGDVLVASVGANNIVGEMSLLCEIPRSATVTAAEPLDTLRIKKDQFFGLLRGVRRPYGSKSPRDRHPLVSSMARPAGSAGAKTVHGVIGHAHSDILLTSYSCRP